uniref:Dynein heavy chain tail domain-containing protein n=1 Tax=Anopheles maculatus TaxID=74869 RepID=A0A182T979_9DIPT
MAEEKKKKDEKEEDPCSAFVGRYVIKTMRLKDEKWQKLIGNEELRTIVMDWVMQPAVMKLFITLNNAGALVPSYHFPSNAKGKICYFVKISEMALEIGKIREQIIYGDLTPNPIDDLSILVDEIFYPMINNPQNQEGWPTAIVKDIDNHVQELRNIISEVKGNIINQTLLPMPIAIDNIMQVGEEVLEGNIDACSLKMKNSLEGIIIKWACQINDVLKEDSAQAFKDGRHPTPVEEINFWESRQKNLRNIYAQLTEPKSRQIGIILEGIDSVYSTSFKNTFKGVV